MPQPEVDKSLSLENSVAAAHPDDRNADRVQYSSRGSQFTLWLNRGGLNRGLIGDSHQLGSKRNRQR